MIVVLILKDHIIGWNMDDRMSNESGCLNPI